MVAIVTTYSPGLGDVSHTLKIKINGSKRTKFSSIRQLSGVFLFFFLAY